MTACAIEPIRYPSSEIALPDDLRVWMDRHTLARLVMAAVQTGGPPIANATSSQDGIAGFEFRILLGVITYCYAIGVYASADIESESGRDAVVRHLCAGLYPEADRLRRFRRHNRKAIQACLAEVLWEAAHLQDGLEGQNTDAMACRQAASRDTQANGRSLLHISDEAEEKINRAARYDSWALDC